MPSGQPGLSTGSRDSVLDPRQSARGRQASGHVQRPDVICDRFRADVPHRWLQAAPDDGL
ncbi:hypothetical protein ACFFX0_22105 [Citricoccus parietis]|uniref:Uncharacterized protein n=1 Tax=Citricoccus parietis TaxID=592307 RepID=A0ABV5G488_9MICC